MATTTSLLAGLASDLLAIALLAYVVYFRRYHRRDLLLAYVALNVGVLAVTTMLTGTQAGIGLGLGLFGILSIIRLRSDQITQEEVAYYFVALALGLVNGLRPARRWPGPGLARGAGLGSLVGGLEIETATPGHSQSVSTPRHGPRPADLPPAPAGPTPPLQGPDPRLPRLGDCAFEVKLKGRRDQTVKARLPYPVAARAHLTVDAREFLADQLLTAYGQLRPPAGRHRPDPPRPGREQEPWPGRRRGHRPAPPRPPPGPAEQVLRRRRPPPPAPARQPLAPHPTPLLPPAGQPLVPVVGWRWRARAPTPHSDTSAHAL